MDAEGIRQEIETKTRRLREYMDDRHLDGTYLRRRDNFSWLSGGGDNHVINASEHGFSGLLVTMDDRYVVTDNIEVERVLAEELGDASWKPITYNWFQPDGLVDKLRELVPGPLMSDVPLPDRVEPDPAFDRLRHTLLPSEIDRLRVLGRDVSGALESTCRQIEPGMTELEIASLLAANAIDAGIEPAARLVGVDERTRRYRHPIPTDTELREHALIVLLGERQGLHVNCTRLVHFGTLPDDLKRNFDIMCRVDVAYILSSEVGAKYSEILEAGIGVYEANGYENEWKKFTQGGAIGYRPREFVVTPDTDQEVMNPQAIAWNPTISGVKGEDTILVSENGLEVLSYMPSWPAVEVDYEGKTISRPGILMR